MEAARERVPCGPCCAGARHPSGASPSAWAAASMASSLCRSRSRSSSSRFCSFRLRLIFFLLFLDSLPVCRQSQGHPGVPGAHPPQPDSGSFPALPTRDQAPGLPWMPECGTTTLWPTLGTSSSPIFPPPCLSYSLKLYRRGRTCSLSPSRPLLRRPEVTIRRRHSVFPLRQFGT